MAGETHRGQQSADEEAHDRDGGGQDGDPAVSGRPPSGAFVMSPRTSATGVDRRAVEADAAGAVRFNNSRAYMTRRLTTVVAVNASMPQPMATPADRAVNRSSPRARWNTGAAPTDSTGARHSAVRCSRHSSRAQCLP